MKIDGQFIFCRNKAIKIAKNKKNKKKEASMRRQMKADYIILSARSYKITSEETGQINEGISMWAINEDNLLPYEDEQSMRNGQINKGIVPFKLNLPLNEGNKIKNIPGIYEVTYISNVVGNKIQERVIDIVYKNDIHIVKDLKQ